LIYCGLVKASSSKKLILQHGGKSQVNTLSLKYGRSLDNPFKGQSEPVVTNALGGCSLFYLLDGLHVFI